MVKTMGSLFFLARCYPPRHFAFQPFFTTNYKKTTAELNMHHAFQEIFFFKKSLLNIPSLEYI